MEPTRIAQNKGKDLFKIPDSKLDTIGPYYCSRKYDGHYCQIIYDGKKVQFFTSGGKKFHLELMAEYIRHHIYQPFHIECEYTYNCKGKLGDRGKSARLTTYRTEYSKGISSRGNKQLDTFRVLDRLDMMNEPFTHRLNSLRYMFDGMDWFMVPMQTLGTLDNGIDLSKQFVKDGYEGAMLKNAKHMYKPGKRTNDIIKLKPRLTADLKCVGFQDGTGKYEGMIGSLVLKDIAGRVVSVGSGLSDHQRQLNPEYFIGKIIEIEYERIDETYIQPVFKFMREDKKESD